MASSRQESCRSTGAQTRARWVGELSARGSERQITGRYSAGMLWNKRRRAVSMRAASMRAASMRDSERIENKGVYVGCFLDLHGCRLALAVTGSRLDADQRGLAVRIGRLHRRGEFETVCREDAVIVIAGDDQRRRIVHAV